MFKRSLHREVNEQINAGKKIQKRVILFGSRRLSRAHLILFYAQLSLLLSSGIPLLQALTVLISSQKNKVLASMLLEIQTRVSRGCYLSEALMHFPVYFDALSCHMIAAGEQTGTMTASLLEVAHYHEEIEKLKKKMVKTLTYPLLLFIVCCASGFYILASIVPKFEYFFVDFNFPMEGLTKGLFMLSHALNKPFVSLSILILPLLMFFFSIKYARFFLKLPWVRSLYSNYRQYRLVYLLSQVLSAGLPLTEGFEWAARGWPKGEYRSRLLQAKEHIYRGYSLTQSVKEAGLFSQEVLQMIAVGEESGSLLEIFKQVGEWVRQENDSFLSLFFAFFEPLMLIMFGLFVLVLVLAIYSPMLKMMSFL
ncbi:MAG: type II secretion system F family protein [Gammaproteobacteria bacterium]|nr:type II secretion system F family protein [Gammaproteobacteria bacterium]